MPALRLEAWMKNICTGGRRCSYQEEQRVQRPRAWEDRDHMAKGFLNLVKKNG